MFVYGPPVPPNLFIGRQSELGYIVSRLAHLGQSSAVVGDPRSGKTSLLSYLHSTAGRDLIRARAGEALDFCFLRLDAHVLPFDVDHAGFWELVLEPISRHAGELAAYQACRASGFPWGAVQQLLARIRAANRRLVILFDEFDDFVRQQVARRDHVLHTLRSHSNTSDGAMAVVLASRTPMKELEEVADRAGRGGSPALNIYIEVPLGPLSDSDVETLLDQGKSRFSPEDRRYVREVAGGHPFLAQVAAEALWSAHESSPAGARALRAAASARVRAETAVVLGDIWKHWPPPVRHIFATVAVEHLDALSGAIGLRDGGATLADTVAYRDEVDRLCAHGFIVEDAMTASGMRVRSFAFLAWCAQELRKQASSPKRWSAWLDQQEWFLSPEQRRMWFDVVGPGLLRTRVDLDLFTTAATPAPRRGDSGSPASPRRRVHIYMSCAPDPEDDALLEELEQHLAGLNREEGANERPVEMMSRKAIVPGADQLAEIHKHLQAADVILLCVSPAFVADDLTWKVEVSQSLQRWQLGACVVPVLLRPVDWETLAIGGIAPLPRDRTPVSSRANRDEAWREVATEIRAIVERIGRVEATSGAT